MARDSEVTLCEYCRLGPLNWCGKCQRRSKPAPGARQKPALADPIKSVHDDRGLECQPPQVAPQADPQSLRERLWGVSARPQTLSPTQEILWGQRFPQAPGITSVRLGASEPPAPPLRSVREVLWPSPVTATDTQESAAVTAARAALVAASASRDSARISAAVQALAQLMRSG
jgi:hypothetical protein